MVRGGTPLRQNQLSLGLWSLTRRQINGLSKSWFLTANCDLLGEQYLYRKRSADSRICRIYFVSSLFTTPLLASCWSFPGYKSTRPGFLTETIAAFTEPLELLLLTGRLQEVLNASFVKMCWRSRGGISDLATQVTLLLLLSLFLCFFLSLDMPGYLNILTLYKCCQSFGGFSGGQQQEKTLYCISFTGIWPALCQQQAEFSPIKEKCFISITSAVFHIGPRYWMYICRCLLACHVQHAPRASAA